MWTDMSKSAKQFRKIPKEGRRNESDAKYALYMGEPLRHRLQLFNLAKKVNGVIVEVAPRVSQGQRASAVIDEHDTQLSLKALDVAAERRLSHSQLFRRTSDVLFLGDSDETTK
jgi:hypothetical protein